MTANSTNGTFTNGTFTNGTYANGTSTATNTSSRASNIVLPLVFVGFWVVLFTLFVRWNKKRQQSLAAGNASASWWGGPSEAHKEYDQLCEKLDPETSEDARQQLGIALINRTMVNIQRAWKLQEEKPSLAKLVGQGAVGEELWQKFLRAEEDLNAEFEFVQAEAEWIKKGWGQGIIPQANHMLQEAMKRSYSQEVSKSGGGSNSCPNSATGSGPNSRSGSQTSLNSGSGSGSGAGSGSGNATEDLKSKEAKAAKLAQELIKQEELEKKKQQAKEGELRKRK